MKLLPDVNNVNSWKNLNKKIITEMNKTLKQMENKTYELILKTGENDSKKALFVKDSLLWFIN